MTSNRTRLLHQPGLSSWALKRAQRAANPLESKIEGDAVKHAKARGWLARKMNGLGFNDWPDRLFLPPPGMNRETNHVRERFWVEFKRRGAKPTPAQARMHKDLRARGERVFVCDSLASFTAVFDKEHNG